MRDSVAGELLNVEVAGQARQRAAGSGENAAAWYWYRRKGIIATMRLV